MTTKSNRTIGTNRLGCGSAVESPEAEKGGTENDTERNGSITAGMEEHPDWLSEQVIRELQHECHVPSFLCV